MKMTEEDYVAWLARVKAEAAKIVAEAGGNFAAVDCWNGTARAFRTAIRSFGDPAPTQDDKDLLYLAAGIRLLQSDIDRLSPDLTRGENVKTKQLADELERLEVSRTIYSSLSDTSASYYQISDDQRTMIVAALLKLERLEAIEDVSHKLRAASESHKQRQGECHA